MEERTELRLVVSCKEDLNKTLQLRGLWKYKTGFDRRRYVWN
jgi:hypothetical protein